MPVEEVISKKKAPLVGFVIGAAWATTDQALARGQRDGPTARG